MINQETGKTECDKCGKELTVGEYPFCPHGFGTSIAVGDMIDVWIKNGIGLINDDGTPKHYTSREELKRATEKAGLTNYVVHGDDDKYTSRWV